MHPCLLSKIEKGVCIPQLVAKLTVISEILPFSPPPLSHGGPVLVICI